MKGSCIIPTLRYENAPRMIDWLCDTFGFARHLVVDDGAGGIAHAQLTFGNAMIMLGIDGAGNRRDLSEPVHHCQRGRRDLRSSTCSWCRDYHGAERRGLRRSCIQLL